MNDPRIDSLTGYINRMDDEFMVGDDVEDRERLAALSGGRRLEA